MYDIVRQLMHILKLLPQSNLASNCEYRHGILSYFIHYFYLIYLLLALPPAECISFVITATLSEVAYFDNRQRDQVRFSINIFISFNRYFQIVSVLMTYFESLMNAIDCLLEPAESSSDLPSKQLVTLLTSTIPQLFGFLRAFGRVLVGNEITSSALVSLLANPVHAGSDPVQFFEEIGSTLLGSLNSNRNILPLKLDEFRVIFHQICRLLAAIPTFNVPNYLAEMIAIRKISRGRFIYSTSLVESFRLNIFVAIRDLWPAFANLAGKWDSAESQEAVERFSGEISTLANELLDIQQSGNVANIPRSPHARLLHVATAATCVTILCEFCTSAKEGEAFIRRLSHQLTSKNAAVTTASVISHRELYSSCLTSICGIVSKFPSINDAAVIVFQNFLSEPAPILLRLARHVLGSQTHAAFTPGENLEVNPGVITDFVGNSAVYGSAAEVLYSLRNQAIDGLIKCQSLANSDSESAGNSILRALPKRLYVVESSTKNSVARDFVSQSILLAVGRLSTAEDAPTWSAEFALNVLQQRLARPPSQVLDTLIVNQLGRIYASHRTRPESAAAVMDIFTRILMAAYSTETSGSTQYRHIVSETVTTLSNVVKQLQEVNETKRLTDLFSRLLRSFVSLGLEAKRKRDQGTQVSSSSIAGGLGQLLPAIAQACKSLPVQTEQPKLFRDVWLFIITSGLAIDSPHPYWFPQWTESVRMLAMKSPVLVSHSDAALTRALLSACALGEDATTPAELMEYRQSLVSLSMPAPLSGSSPLPPGAAPNSTTVPPTAPAGKAATASSIGAAADTASMVSRLSFAHCTYLLSVYKLEKYRAEMRCITGDDSISPSGIDGIFAYLEDRVLQREKSGIYLALVAIADSVFNSLLVAVAEQTNENVREQLLDRLTQLLLVKFNHPNKTIRRTADSFLTRLVARYSHVLWSRRVLSTVLDILQVLSDGMANEPPGQVVDLLVPDTPNYKLQLPDNMGARESLLFDFGLRAADIFREAMRWAPGTTRSHAIHYLLRSGDMGMTGLAPTAQGVLRFVGIGHGGAISNANVPAPAHSLSLWQQLMNRCQYAAKLAGFKTGFTSAEKKAGQLYQMYIESLRIQGSSSNKNQPKSSSCHDQLFSATALLVSASDIEKDEDDDELLTRAGRERALLAAICRHAVTHHRADCASAAIACFDWLLSARPDLSGRLIASLSASFQVACVLRQGLFAVDPDAPLDLFSEEAVRLTLEGQPGQNSDDPVLPHVIILRFLCEKAVLAQFAQSTDAEILTALSLRCLRPSLMSRSLSALTAKALLAIVALNLLQSEALIPVNTTANMKKRNCTGSVIRTALRDRVYATLLDHFSAPLPMILRIDESIDLKPLITDLIRLWNAINHEKKYFPEPVKPGANNLAFTSGGNHPPSSMSGPSSPVGAPGSSTSGGFVNTGNIIRHDVEQQHTYRPASISLSSKRRARLVKTTEQNAEVGYVRSWRSKRTLLLLFLAHEIERLQVWYNPTGQPNRMVPGFEQIRQFRDIVPQTKDKVWRDIVKHAWTISPAVAVGFSRRFPFDAIKNELSRLVTNEPLIAFNIPDALSYLASIRNLENDSKQLTYVLHWTHTDPITALAYFSRRYPPHPLTHQYAARVLKTSTPSALLPYIPQMVQALRHDPMGYMASVLVWLASHSQLLTHQLIWNMRTNIYRDDAGLQRDGVLGPIVDSLLIAIENQLEGDGKQFFKREFDFFAQLVNVSAKIRPFPKGPQRKQECLAAIRQVQLPEDGGVYLPSNPESLTVGIDYTSATPMQSAAKAPYLARFASVHCGLDSVERIGKGEMPIPKGLEVKKQGAIFKVGDDVRQDILALQIIRGLRSSFQAAGLNSVASGLAPYRVVATAPGCGVIECVPDSQSIDQIGKATDTSLYEYFLAKYGEEQAPDFQKVRGNFIKSMAAYSLICYLLQIKDRHNGNLMIDGSGRIVHIDFGFLFESSPGGNLGFEPDFKLSRELLIVMAGTMPQGAQPAGTDNTGQATGQLTWPETSPSFQQFIDLCIRAYLVARQLDEPIITLVSLMLDTGLPCFRGRTIEQLKTRLGRQRSEKEAADHMLQTIRYCCQNWRAGVYDWLQYQQNEIQYH